MTKILKIITAEERERYIKWRLNALARKLSMINRNRVRGSIRRQSAPLIRVRAAVRFRLEPLEVSDETRCAIQNSGLAD